MAWDLMKGCQTPRDWSLGADDKEKRMKASAEKAKLHIAQKREELSKRFDSPVPQPELVALVSASLDKISKMDDSISSIEAHTGWGREKKAVQNARKRLGELLVTAKGISGTLRPKTNTANEFRKWVLSPYDITIAAIEHKGMPAYETIATVWELPASVITYTAETIKKVADKALPAMGLPKWFLPVTVGGLGLAVVLGVYQNTKSFTLVGGHR